MKVVPLTLRQANEFIEQHHRHHKKAQGHRFSVGVQGDNGQLLGVAVVGRPVARKTDQYNVCEVVRLCTTGCKNVCSMLYASAARAAEAMGFSRIQTFILDTEPGTSLKATSWVKGDQTPGKSWSVPSRQRIDKCVLGKRVKWFRDLRRAKNA